MISLIFGTRPEAIKLAPVANALRGRLPLEVICTGQHTDLLSGTPEFRNYNYHYLKLPSNGDVSSWLQRAQPKIRSALLEANARVVVVQGDTMSALAGARAARELGLVLAHVEAGVRSGNLQEPWPEEGFRREITKLADWHYAPTSTAYANLFAEGVPSQRILMLGNTVVSTLAASGVVPLAPEPFLLMTMHRREWLATVNATEWIQALTEAARKHPTLSIIWPMHPAVMAKWGVGWLGSCILPGNLNLTSPMPYGKMLDKLSRCQGLLTDSGGLVEEAATLGIPTAILRRYNDRPEAVEVGIARQYPPTAEGLAEGIAMLSGAKIARFPTSIYGLPSAARHIAEHLERLYCSVQGEDQ
jgi:UDP-N-acetylglucosamine 2-epimerase (non-hydrolysing)